ncbi:MAG: acetamidase [Dactylosporangium sp.]|nr:acetamidase [Dactylosporangium sp.]
MEQDDVAMQAVRSLMDGLGRRNVLRAAAALGAAGAIGGHLLRPEPAAAATVAGNAEAAGNAAMPILQPGTGRVRGAYLTSSPETVKWGYLPNRTTPPVLTVPSGGVVTIDTVSHEGIMEDQGRDPDTYFGDHGVPRDHVLNDARAIARSSLTHDFANDGPHVVTGPVSVTGARPGDVLKVEVLELQMRVPYGVVSSRHGLGALPGEYPESIVHDPQSAPYLTTFDNISVFTPLEHQQGAWHGVMPAAGHTVAFPLAPFMGLMGVATDTNKPMNSVPPNLGGGNLDIKRLGAGSTLYLPVQVPGALFFAGDPHFVQGDGEVALTALEASLRGTFRLTVIKPGGAAPQIAFSYPFAETADHWIPFGLSDPNAQLNDHPDTSLDDAMKTAVRNAITFLHQETGMAKAVAYAYLSAAADFQVSQVVDQTKGVHALIRKADFGRRHHQ